MNCRIGIRGVQEHMQQFEFFWHGVECLSEAAMTIRTLKSNRADDKFALFCKDVTTLAENLVNAPVLPRRRRLPARYEDGDAPAEFYFDALDKWAMSITDCFVQRYYMFCAS